MLFPAARLLGRLDVNLHGGSDGAMQTDRDLEGPEMAYRIGKLDLALVYWLAQVR